MKALIQRVLKASVRVDGKIVGKIGPGVLAFVGVEKADDEVKAHTLVDKLLRYRVFSDDDGKMNRSVADVEGGLLLVSQFTLVANTDKGLRPSFSGAAAPGQANVLFDKVCGYAQSKHSDVACGVFAADMQVELVNDGPVTFLLSV